MALMFRLPKQKSIREKILPLISKETAAGTVGSPCHFAKLEETAWFSLATSFPAQTIYFNAVPNQIQFFVR